MKEAEAWEKSQISKIIYWWQSQIQKKEEAEAENTEEDAEAEVPEAEEEKKNPLVFLEASVPAARKMWTVQVPSNIKKESVIKERLKGKLKLNSVPSAKGLAIRNYFAQIHNWNSNVFITLLVMKKSTITEK